MVRRTTYRRNVLFQKCLGKIVEELVTLLIHAVGEGVWKTVSHLCIFTSQNKFILADHTSTSKELQPMIMINQCCSQDRFRDLTLMLK